MKIERIDQELEKARAKAAEWQAKVRELEKLRQEEENTQIVQMVRALNMTPSQLADFLNNQKAAPAAPIREKEVTVHDED